jgi:hypothetical protein
MKTRRKTCLTVTLSIINSTRTNVHLDLDLYSKQLATKRLNYDTAFNLHLIINLNNRIDPPLILQQSKMTLSVAEWTGMNSRGRNRAVTQRLVGMKLISLTPKSSPVNIIKVQKAAEVKFRSF